jgi:hypothetical protein
MNGAKTIGARILGNVTVEISSAIFTANQFSSINVLFAAGTSGCSLDLSNVFSGGATIVNDGNINNYIARETSGGGSSLIKYGEDSDTYKIKRDLLSGDSLYAGYLDVPNNRGFRARNAADSAYVKMISLDSSDRINIGSASSGFTTISSGSGGVYFNVGGATEWQFSTTSLRPQVDNSNNLGTSSQRLKTIYAVTGTINTSDEREKQQIQDVSDRWLDAWQLVDFNIYKWNEAVSTKGDKARFHVGLIAQKIEIAFKSLGLDAFEIGLLCYDEWKAEKAIYNEDDEIIIPEKAAGNRYGIRADECLFMEAALNHRELKKIKNEIKIIREQK